MNNRQNNQEDRMILVLALIVLSALSFWAFAELDTVDYTEQDRILAQFKNNQ